MKFGKSLGNQIEDALPEWRDKFLSYKDLKKRLKLISGGGGERLAKRPKVADDVGPGDRDPSSAPESAAMPVVEEEEDFMRLLEAELDKFNTFFVEKEEEYIIRQKVSALFPFYMFCLFLGFKHGKRIFCHDRGAKTRSRLKVGVGDQIDGSICLFS